MSDRQISMKILDIMAKKRDTDFAIQNGDKSPG